MSDRDIIYCDTWTQFRLGFIHLKSRSNQLYSLFTPVILSVIDVLDLFSVSHFLLCCFVDWWVDFTRVQFYHSVRIVIWLVQHMMSTRIFMLICNIYLWLDWCVYWWIDQYWYEWFDLCLEYCSSKSSSEKSKNYSKVTPLRLIPAEASSSAAPTTEAARTARAISASFEKLNQQSQKNSMDASAPIKQKISVQTNGAPEAPELPPKKVSTTSSSFKPTVAKRSIDKSLSINWAHTTGENETNWFDITLLAGWRGKRRRTLTASRASAPTTTSTSCVQSPSSILSRTFTVMSRESTWASTTRSSCPNT